MLIAFLVGCTLGFGFGYSLRDWKSRQRRRYAQQRAGAFP